MPLPSVTSPPAARALRLRRALGVVIVALVVGLGPLAAGGHAVGRALGQAPVVRQPCDLMTHRTVAPRIVAAGQLVTLTVAWDYRCDQVPQPARALLLLVEDTAALAGVEGGLPGRVRAGLTGLVDAVDVSVGGRLGLTRFGPSGPEWRTPLAAGEGGRSAVRAAIGQLGGRLGGFAHTVSALEDAAAQLVAVPTGQDRLVLLVDSGAPLVTGTTAQGAILRCLALRDEGVRVVVLSLATADRRLEACARPGDFWASTSPDGHDLPGLVDRLTLHLFGDPYVTSSAYTETLAAGWTLVAEGTFPRVPDDILAEGLFAWYQPAPAPPGGHRVIYRVRAPQVDAPLLAPVSRPNGPRIGLGRGDAPMLVTHVDDVPVCVFPVGAPEGCADHAAHLTATAAGTPATATATPALTPPTPTSVFTAVPPTAATPTPATPGPSATPTRTPRTTAYRVFAPFCYAPRR